MSDRARLLVLAALLVPGPLLAQTEAPAALERVTFDEAVRRALDKNPTVGEAAQAIARAQGLLDQARSVFRPLVVGAVGETILDAARGFDGNIVTPQRQSSFSGTASYSLLALSRWAQARQAADQVGIARISAEEARRDVALSAAQAYLAVIAAERESEIATRNRDTARALAEYARARLEAGQGSRLNFVRARQELAAAEALVQAAELAVRRAQEALGVAIFADAPVDASGDPDIPAAAPPSEGDAWLSQRPDFRLFTAEVQAADRVVRDTWKSWLPTAVGTFTPQYVTPKGLFEPAGTWRALIQLQVPVYDGTLGSTRRIRIAEREAARFRLQAVTVQARSELRSAQEEVARRERIVAANREAAGNAVEALHITEIAYRAGATTNVEVVQAQQTARNAEIGLAVGEDRLRQARLDLLVALGQFPQ